MNVSTVINKFSSYENHLVAGVLNKKGILLVFSMSTSEVNGSKIRLLLQLSNRWDVQS